MCPLLTDTGLYAFIVPTPKQKDLHRDGRYAMHSFPLDDKEDAFYLRILNELRRLRTRPHLTPAQRQLTVRLKARPVAAGDRSAQPARSRWLSSALRLWPVRIGLP